MQLVKFNVSFTTTDFSSYKYVTRKIFEEVILFLFVLFFRLFELQKDQHQINYEC